MSLKLAASLGILALWAAGCGGPALGGPGDARHWTDSVPDGAAADRAKETLAENQFQHWSTGRIIYGTRDTVASKTYSDDVSVNVYLDPDRKVTDTEAYATAPEPYPQWFPTYP